MSYRARRDHLMAQRVEVGIIFFEMLGEVDAATYLRQEGVPEEIIHRVLHIPHLRRRCQSSSLQNLIGQRD